LKENRQRAERYFAEHLAGLAEHESADVSELCARHPELAEDLRELHAECLRAAETYGKGGGAERGSAFDAPPFSADTPSGRLLRELCARAPSDSRYRLVGEVARGGMGAILRVWDSDLRRMLAMKVALGSASDAEDGASPLDPRTLDRFLEEAQVTGQLDHPGIVPVHELGVDRDGHVYFTMRLVKGRDLSEVFDLVGAGEPEWTLTGTLSMLLRASEALAYAHEKGVVHRDLKPANVMVGRFGEVYVMDWGLAHVLGTEDRANLRIRPPESIELTSLRKDSHADGSPLVTMDGDVIGTPAYMSPEQARGDIELLDKCSDVYSLGAMLYELVASQPPYTEPGRHRSPREILDAVLAGPPKDILEVRSDVPAELVAICEKAMAREREQRYPGMLEFAADLRAYLEKRVVHAYETGPLAEARKWVARNPGMAAALAALVVLVVGASLFVARQERTKQTELRAAYDVVEAERDAKRSLSDLMTAQVLLSEADDHTPDAAGIASMERWLERWTDIGTRRADYTAERAGGAPGISADERRSLSADLVRLDALAPAVRERLAVARSLYRRSIEDEREAWDEVTAAVAASEVYGNLDLEPQLGLVPLREDTYSGLWEFWHVVSGERPRYDRRAGRYELTPESGLVLVLLPPGTYSMGSPESEYGRNANESLHEVSLDAFFLSKFETTQGQWRRAMESNPSFYAAERSDELQLSLTGVHPVESMNWDEATRFAQRLGLRLPTEEESEYATRAGTRSRFFWGDSEADLEGAENLADASFTSFHRGTSPEVAAAPWDDGYPVHAPVGTFRANGFGLYDMHGNVAEWTSSLYSYTYGTPEGIGRVTSKGGGFFWGPSFARSALRGILRTGHTNRTLGVRLALSLARRAS